MTSSEAGQILKAIEKLGDQQGETREELARHTGKVEAQLEGVGKSLRRVDKRLDSVDHTQRKHGERIAKLEVVQPSPPPAPSPDATGRHSAVPANPPPRPWSLPPSVRRERIRQVGKVAALVVTTAGAILLAYLGVAH